MIVNCNSSCVLSSLLCDTDMILLPGLPADFSDSGYNYNADRKKVSEVNYGGVSFRAAETLLNLSFRVDFPG